jgi:hypothetical protein
MVLHHVMHKFLYVHSITDTSLKFSMDKDLNLRRLNPFKTDINIVRHNFKNQSQQTDLRKHFPGETYPTTSNKTNQSLRENNT